MWQLLSRVSRAEELDVIRLRCPASYELVSAVAADVSFNLSAYFSEA